ncbi:response regulator [Sneathiella chinensis]|uniref:Response regulator n=1 Tax=Sneathiella chinensis TaxID=349750 RepID=A0ABQ5U438_9PROT|nr:response regulator [Sneathiella chinensis]GLQ06930.1 response regulator [Sneathiella chinensis]
MRNREVTILLIEDDEIDILATKKALQEVGIANPLVEARDGIEGLETLRGENGRKKVDFPFIILLDLNMPRMNGLEFLEIIRGDDVLRRAIVFVMTTSEAEIDICRSYEKNIAGYIVKSNRKNSFTEAIRLLKHYWKIIEMPPKGIILVDPTLP